MGKNRPLFSIILPTYNRADILPLAIKSVLQQTFADFELIVCNSASTDNTREIVTAIDDVRLRYVETENRLSMGENYEYATNQAIGEYIVFFSDDDALVPTMLERVERVIKNYSAKMIVFPIASYYHLDSEDYNCQIKKNTLLFFPYSRQVLQIMAEYAARQMFNDHNLINIPRDAQLIRPFIGNVVYHHSIIEQYKARTPKMFPIIPIDMYMITMTLGFMDEYYCLDEPLLVWSRWTGNATASIKDKGSGLRQHYERLLDGEPLRYVPFKFALPLNCQANALLQAKNDLGGELDYLEIDWAWYFIKIYEYLNYLQGSGVNTEQELEEFNQTLAKQTPDVQNRVHSATRRFNIMAKQKLHRHLPSVARMLKRLLIKSPPLTMITGETAGFNDVLECAQFLDKNLQKFANPV